MEEKTMSLPEYITILVAYTDLKSVEEVNNKKNDQILL